MLIDAVSAVLPSAVAVALSPFPVVAVILVLGSHHARTSGPTFAVGWVTGLTVLTTAVVVLLGDAEEPGSQTATGVGWMELLLGVGLLALALREWRTRTRADDDVEMPGWMATVDGAGPGRALGLGFVLAAANPKNLALTLAASASIAELGLTATDTTVAVAAYVLVGSSTVLGAVAYRLVRAERAAAGLESVKAFMVANNAVIMMVILLIFGVKLVVDGLADL